MEERTLTSPRRALALASACVAVAGCASLDATSGARTGVEPQAAAVAAADPGQAEPHDTGFQNVAVQNGAIQNAAVQNGAIAAIQNAGAEAADAHAPPEGAALAALAKSAFATAGLSGKPAISPVRPTHDNQWGDWVFCITGNAPSPRYAVLVVHSRVLAVRSSISIDGCERETYQPLAPPPPVGKAASRR